MREYMAQRRATRRRRLVELLGSQCIKCGSVENLQFDHIVPGSRSFVLSGKWLDQAWEKILKEVNKCQLLCYPCHVNKTKECGESGGGHNKNNNPFEHGTMRCYQETSCKCEICKIAKRMYRNREISYTQIIPL